MSCPNCHCPACMEERVKWLKPFAPFPPITTQPPAPGMWKCGCGRWHEQGFTCIQYVGGKP